MSRPSSRIVPAVGVRRRVISRPMVDLPEPLSPTRPSVSPGPMSNDTPTTAWTGGADRNRPVPEVNDFCRSRASKSDAGTAMLAGVVRL